MPMFEGVFVPHITPFDDEEKINEEMLRELVHYFADEIPREALSLINAEGVIIDAQGFLREIENSRVVLKEINGEFLKNAQVVHADAYEFQHIRNLNPDDVEVLLISNGAESGVAYHRGKKYLYHPLRIDLDDPTGAGDVFLASFAYFYMKCPFVQALKRANAFTATF